MKSKILPNCLKRKYGYHLGKFSNTPFELSCLGLKGLNFRLSTQGGGGGEGYSKCAKKFCEPA